MSENSDKKAMIGQLYDTMSKEADGFYRQMITICTSFLGGSLVFFDKLFVNKVEWSLGLLFAAWFALTYPLAVLACIRWGNIEAHRHALEYIKTDDYNEYQQAKFIPKKGRKLTKSAIFSMVAGLFLIALFTVINILCKHIGGKP